MLRVIGSCDMFLTTLVSCVSQAVSLAGSSASAAPAFAQAVSASLSLPNSEIGNALKAKSYNPVSIIFLNNLDLDFLSKSLILAKSVSLKTLRVASLLCS